MREKKAQALIEHDKSNDGKYAKKYGFDQSRFSIVGQEDSNLQLDYEGEGDDVQNFLSHKQHQRKNEQQKLVDEEDRKNLMADGLIHRPNGTIIDLATRSIVNGANDQLSSPYP